MTNRTTPAFAALAIGTLCILMRQAGRNDPDPKPEHEARVTAQNPDDGYTVFEFTDPDMALTHGEVNLYHDDGQSPSGVWSFGEQVHEPESEDKPEVIEEPKALALNLPRGANWLMEQAKTLEAEAERYKDSTYGSPEYTVKGALNGAAHQLRSAVGHALTVEQKQDITPR